MAAPGAFIKSELDLADCINAVCPWSGKPVAADSLTLYRVNVVGFCNTGCRDKFDTAAAVFDTTIAGLAGKGAGERE